MKTSNRCDDPEYYAILDALSMTPESTPADAVRKILALDRAAGSRAKAMRDIKGALSMCIGALESYRMAAGEDEWDDTPLMPEAYAVAKKALAKAEGKEAR